MKTWMKWAVGVMFLSIPLNAAAADKAVTAFVSIPPQKAFVERIGGERVEVKVLLTPGESPAMYRPKPSVIAGLGGADLFFRMGLPYETHLMPKIRSMAGNLQVVDTRKGVPLLAMAHDHHHHHHDHDSDAHHHEGDGHDEGYEGMDPHIWLDPGRVAIQAVTMRDALIARDPSGRPVYEAGCSALLQELDSLDAEIARALAPLAGETLYVFHPAFGYFADAYGLVQKAVEVEGKSPKGKALSRYIAQARADGVRVIFVQPQFDRHTAEKVAAALDGAVVPLDPLAEDYFGNLGKIADAVSLGLKKQGE
ncbi:metal ABC transporter solute-binding protein, Zn/Mn family [Desulfoluna butyratoxydans]|uniref:Periplasmic solute binding protein znua-like n=1 Tax=Desulfoluna butyratoxydans TaxID=231438 RepID=A0A4U8YNF8_9BACT|nr:zinc ABC transporter substrate-binding protein [Desulfoluna butyratoxydans]VFQ45144.1 periplasmic solute binding protein znua-like [Desulfoluna butyratoxydans]